MKKGDDKWAGPYEILAVYPRACRLQLPEQVRIFPVFHASLLRPVDTDDEGRRTGLPGQATINENESRHLKGRTLERDDEVQEMVEKWEFEKILDCHDEDGLNYLIKWKHHAATWQPATDLKGNDAALLDFHARHPGKPGPPPGSRNRSPLHLRDHNQPLPRHRNLPAAVPAFV